LCVFERDYVMNGRFNKRIIIKKKAFFFFKRDVDYDFKGS